MKKEIYLPEDKETRALLHAVEDEKRATGKSFSKIVLESLREHTDRTRMWVQARLTDYQDEFVARIERLHEELVYPNPGMFPTWKTCLEANGLLTREAIEYSAKRGWRVD
ncbi:MAG: hypothetical protein JRM82_03785 [Nitrososphaerota archaeon]|nr:hypothetical protein [Nitrososphaerota archaeon]